MRQLASLVMVLDFTAPMPLDLLAVQAIVEEVGHLSDTSALVGWCAGQTPLPMSPAVSLTHLRDLGEADRTRGDARLHAALPSLGLRRLPLGSTCCSGRSAQMDLHGLLGWLVSCDGGPCHGVLKSPV